ncbi:MAG TPA: RagB/SusD family nutrient uptake outer membrane protein [Bacteroidales bacterium]|nr:RagB/SusD family nutrient uptake outer membrane protein [Bacteroidales bacterium]
MKLFKYIFCIIIAIALSNCSEDMLDLKPKDMLDVNTLLGDPAGVEVIMANLYYKLPVEDFLYYPRLGYDQYYGKTRNNLNRGEICAQLTDDANYTDKSTILDNTGLEYWDYSYIRNINQLIDIIPTLTIKDEDKATLLAECSFLRAYAYFEMVKRYGGVPIIKIIQEWTGNVEVLKVPRNTEKETWDFVMSECDVAIAGLPEVNKSSSRRANKFVALALKSRAALHAASVAKYWNKAPLIGTAVDQGLVGMPASDANGYYIQCIEASEAIMNSGKYSLYMPTPANPAVAAENYRKLFEDPNVAPMESIFISGFVSPIREQAHNYDVMFGPVQCSQGWNFSGRCNPTLDLVDIYESYSNPGQSAPIVTTTDGVTNDYNGYKASNPYIRWDNTYDIFNGKDARLFASVILPGTTWKGITIVIQAGYVQPDGVAKIETKQDITVNGVKYYTFGGANTTQYSGFDLFSGTQTLTGFSLKKFLQEAVNVTPKAESSTSDWVDMRYAEVLLNYAEAVVESGYTANDAQTKAFEAMNSTRRRAGHTVDIPLTLTNVFRERRVELAFENKRIWDLLRRREYHEVFTGTVRHALAPVLDLRVDPPKYIFVRKYRSSETAKTFLPRQYYRSIPDVAASGLVQNPEY